ncbi:MAG: TonB family protein [Candidatus Korobacteraceae bacterium]
MNALEAMRSVIANRRAWWLTLQLLLIVVAISIGRAEGESRAFVNCSTKAGSVPTYTDVCLGKRSGEIACGEQVEILEREGGFFRVRSKSGETYVSAASISRSPKRFDPIPLQGPVPPPDCGTAWAAERSKLSGKQHPYAWFHPDPQYTEAARKAKLQGSVVLSVTVDITGRPSDIHVEKSLGRGLDEQAVSTLSQWRFDPAREDGNPVPVTIKVEMTFRLY